MGTKYVLVFLIFLFAGIAHAANSAQYLSHSVPSNMVAGQTYSVSVTMKNAGTSSWTAADSYRLGSQNPQDNWNWGLGRVYLSSGESIAPGQTKTFSFSVTAPNTPGNYNFQWRMLREYVEWFGDYSANSAVRVTGTYLHVLSSGQSLSVGGESSPALSTSQPYNNVMLSPDVQGTAGPFIPLVESGVETPSSAIGNGLRSYDALGRPVVVSLHGVGGYAYYQLKKGTTPYANGMQQASATKALVESGGNTYDPAGVTIVHGESDYWNGNSSQYEGSLVEWQRDYQNDINALTGGTSVLPMFINQMNTAATGELAVAQLSAHKNNPGKIILVEPKYQYTYVPTYHIHVNNVASKHMGEMFAKAMKKVVLDGQTWNPLMPTRVVRTGNIIIISYAIPVGTLAIDTTNVAARPNYGFEYVQTGGTATTITSVALVNGSTQVQLTLSWVPDGTNQRVRYAWSCYAGNIVCGDPANSTWVGGNIRDTDSSVSPVVGSTGVPLYDWGVTFDEPIALPDGSACTQDSQCASNRCAEDAVCCQANQCAWDMCVSVGSRRGNQWLDGICVNGLWQVAPGGYGNEARWGCYGGATKISGLCKLPLGSACSTSYQCYMGSTSIGTCVECASGYCVGGVCSSSSTTTLSSTSTTRTTTTTTTSTTTTHATTTSSSTTSTSVSTTSTTTTLATCSSTGNSELLIGANPVSFETPHNYPNDLDCYSGTYSCLPGYAARVHAKYDTESYYDYFYIIHNSSSVNTTVYSGNSSGYMWIETGYNSLRFRFTSDYSIARWGVSVDMIDCLLAEPTTTSSTTTTSISITSTSSTTSMNATTTTSTTVQTTTTTTLAGPCVIKGNEPPCEIVSLSEVIDAINQWASGDLALGQVIDLINSWADPSGHPPN